MSKLTSALLVILNLVIVAGFLFLALEMDALNKRDSAKALNQQSETVNQDAALKEIEKLKLELAEHKTAIGNLADKIDTLSGKISESSTSSNSAKPKFALEHKIFSVSSDNDSLLLVTGFKNPVANWIKSQGLIVENILAGSWEAEFNETDKVIVINGVVADSIFDQMGFEKGDAITMINGALPTGLDDIKKAIIAMSPISLSLKRGQKTFAYKLNYDSIETGSVTLDFSSEQFRGALDRVFDSLRLAPVMQAGKIYGVKILEVDSQGVFAAIGFTSQDVITHLDDEPVSLKGFQERLATVEFPATFKFEREASKRMVTVQLAR